MDSDLSLDFLRVVEQAAIACGHTMGQGDGHKADQAAVESMRSALDTVPIDGTIVIGALERAIAKPHGLQRLDQRVVLGHDRHADAELHRVGQPLRARAGVGMPGVYQHGANILAMARQDRLVEVALPDLRRLLRQPLLQPDLLGRPAVEDPVGVRHLRDRLTSTISISDRSLSWLTFNRSSRK